MTIDDIKQLISKDEHRQLELKKTTGELKDGMRTACAFLNTDGGWLIIGIAPVSLKILGQRVTDNTQREIAQYLTAIEPAVKVDVEYVDVPDYPENQVIAMYFEAFVWGHQPYTYDSRPYYKVESTTKLMPREMFEECIRASKPQYYAWERQQADRVQISDLNEERVRGAIRLGVERGRMMASSITESFEKVLDKLQLLTDGVPNNAAAALFGTNLFGYTQFRLRMARFRGTNKNSFIDNQRVEGNFFDLLDAGMAFFFKHLSLSGDIVGFVREEHLEIPAVALREALINALCHRQYEKYNLTIGIAIYDDRVEIESPGILPPQLTTETIKQPHLSYPYNPIIANVLFKTTFLENWGSGAGRIMDACKTQNVEVPNWVVQGGFVVVTFRRPAKSVTLQLEGNLSPTCHQLVTNLSDQIKSLIIVMNEEPMSIPELQSIVIPSLKSRRLFKEKFVNPALKQGLIEMTHPEQPNHPKQQYRLTEIAKEWKCKQPK
jgi:ATP-dependent DNA helicase RecG